MLKLGEPQSSDTTCRILRGMVWLSLMKAKGR